LNQPGKAFIFIGPPGAGKGSLSSLCIKQFGWIAVSTGNLCRKHIAEQTKIGKEIDLIIKSGKLINDELISDMVSEWFAENADKVEGVILDGYPRTVAQALIFDTILKSLPHPMEKKVVSFSVLDDLVVNRLCCRFVCQNKDCQEVYSVSVDSDLVPKTSGICDECGGSLGRRVDDAETFVRSRLEIYHRHEQELLDFYRANGDEIIELNAEKPLQDVFENFVQSVIE
jgi:adenylate kinase